MVRSKDTKKKAILIPKTLAEREIIAYWIVHFREEKGWSRTRLAEESGVDYSLIGKYERLDTRPRKETVAVLAKTLGVKDVGKFYAVPESWYESKRNAFIESNKKRADKNVVAHRPMPPENKALQPLLLFLDDCADSVKKGMMTEQRFSELVDHLLRTGELIIKPELENEQDEN